MSNYYDAIVVSIMTFCISIYILASKSNLRQFSKYNTLMLNALMDIIFLSKISKTRKDSPDCH